MREWERLCSRWDSNPRLGKSTSESSAACRPAGMCWGTRASSLAQLGSAQPQRAVIPLSRHWSASASVLRNLSVLWNTVKVYLL